MTPVWMIEGGAAALEPETTEANLASHNAGGADAAGESEVVGMRFAALAEAVREHQSRRRHTAIPARPEDVALYRRLRQICGG